MSLFHRRHYFKEINRPLIGWVCAEWVGAEENIFISEGLSWSASLYFITFVLVREKLRLQVYWYMFCVYSIAGTVVVVVVFTLTDRASTIPSNIHGCQSGTWSQRGTKVNGSHHGDNPLLKPTGIQIATKSYATLQAMAPTNNKTVNQTSFTPFREQPRSTRIVVAYPRPAFSATNRTNSFQPVLINNFSKFLKATHRTKIRKIEIPRSMVVKALSW